MEKYDPKKEKIRLISFKLMSAKMALDDAKNILRIDLKERHLSNETRLWYQERMMSMYFATKEYQIEYNSLKGVIV